MEVKPRSYRPSDLGGERSQGLSLCKVNVECGMETLQETGLKGLRDGRGDEVV